MIHQLALATNPQLMEKLSAISMEDHMAGQARDTQKAIDMAAARGHAIPMKVQQKWVGDQATGKMVEELVPDMDNLRMSKQTPHAPAAAKTAPGLIEKEIQQKHTGLTPTKKLRHKTIGGLKRYWGGQGGLGGKWRNRLGLIGGLGAVGLGIKSYMDSNRLTNPAVAQQQLQPGYNKMSAFPYVQDAANIPKPPSQPKVPSPGPGVAGVGSMSSKKPSGALGAPKAMGGTSGSSKETLAAYLGEKRADDAMLPVLAGGLGGIGGWALGDKILKPMLESKEQNLAEVIAKHQKNMARIKGAKQAVPLGSAAAGALILAALAAIKARQYEHMAQQQQQYAPTISAYDQSGGGYVPNNAVHPGFY